MKLREYLEEINKLIEENPNVLDMEIGFSDWDTKDEGVFYYFPNPVYPSIGFYDEYGKSVNIVQMN